MFDSNQFFSGGAAGFYPKTLAGSLRFNSGDAPYLSFTNGTATNGKKCTLSFWIKKNEIIGSTTTARFMQAYSGTGNQFHSQWGDGSTSPGDQWNISPGEQSSQQGMRLTDASLRDPSAWYHCVWKYNSESGSEESTLYVNGVQQSSSGYTTAPTTNLVTSLTKSGTEVKIGYINSSMPDFQLAELFILDGQSLDADSFGETKNGVWVPKNVTASDFTMGNNGVHLTFEDDTEVEAFNTTLHRGTGATQSVTGTGFSPDLVWIKNRDNADNHYLFDTVRGVNRYLNSDTTGAEDYSANDLNSFDSDGFTVGSDGGLNRSGQAIVAWQWDAGANNASTGHSSVIYEGSGSTSQRITGFPFSPDLLWLKCRGAAENHNLMDTVRGWGKRLKTNASDAEQTFSGGGFYEDGFAPETTSDDQNKNATDFVAWAWDAGDSDPVSNTDGDVTSTVKASTANGFSVVTYTATGSGDIEVGHGLSQAPDFIIGKTRNQAYDWRVYHSAVGATKSLQLNGTSAASTNNAWGQTEPTSTVFTAGRGGDENMNFASGDTIVTYCFHDVAGKQKFGSYQGNASSTGPTVNLGFRPGFVMIKGLDRSSVWYMFDTSRMPFDDATNYNHKYLRADSSNAEYTVGDDGKIEVTSTGFQIRSGVTGMNASGEDYIYAAFAGSYPDFITDYNTDGTIDSRVKANDTTGFSIVSYTGNGTASQTIGHGLGSAPTNWMVILKNRTSGSTDWPTFHSSISSGRLKLNTTDDDFGNYPITFGTDTITLPSVNDLAWSASSNDYIAYCWTATTGVSAFGSYTGNGTSHTETVGFKPAFILIKRYNTSAAATNWEIHDNTRNTGEELLGVLYPNTSGIEGFNNSGSSITTNSTSFTVNGSGGSINGNNDSYLYAAFADTREAAFWLDQSSNDNDWQPNNLDHNDTVADSPTDNFATFNPQLLAKYSATGYRTFGDFSDGNLLLTTNADNESGTVSFGATSGKYYMEFTSENLAQRQQIIVYSTDDFRSDTGAVTTSSDGGGNATDRVSWTTGDVIGIAVDVDNSKVFIHKNGDYFGTSNPVTNTGGDTLNSFTGVGVRQDSGSTGSAKISFNAGQQPFKYGPPE